MTLKRRVNRKAPLSKAAKQAIAKARKVEQEREFLANLKALGLPVPIPEYAFAKSLGRNFRWDYCWADRKLALEVDGGIWTRGAHGRGTGIKRDQEKGNYGAVLGWRLLRVQPADLPNPSTAEWVRDALLTP